LPDVHDLTGGEKPVLGFRFVAMTDDVAARFDPCDCSPTRMPFAAMLQDQNYPAKKPGRTTAPLLVFTVGQYQINAIPLSGVAGLEWLHRRP
jgi:hypothetical protein